MKRQHKAQDSLPIEVERHPMWTPPTEDDAVTTPPHICELRRLVAATLTPFDGRPGVQTDAIVDFASQIYLATALATSWRDPIWLMGQVCMAYHRTKRNDMPAVKRLLDRSIDSVATNAGLK